VKPPFSSLATMVLAARDCLVVFICKEVAACLLRCPIGSPSLSACAGFVDFWKIAARGAFIVVLCVDELFVDADFFLALATIGSDFEFCKGFVKNG